MTESLWKLACPGRDAVVYGEPPDGETLDGTVEPAGETGIDVYRAVAQARRTLGPKVRIRVRWDGVLDVKGAALALTFGADELAGPLATRDPRRLPQLGGAPEDARCPTAAYVEALIRAAGHRPIKRS